MNKKELWLNIVNYHFDHLVPTSLWDEISAKFGGQNPFTKAFADKLSRKLNWKKNFASKAIWEYKKFVYMGVISDFSVTPSKVIDQVWHEHLLFSSGYRKFCKDVIRYDFDHNPELVNIGSQTEAFASQYFQTIELYKKEFGIEPPSEIWDTTKFTGKNEKIKKPEKNQNDSSDSYSTSYSDNYAEDAPLISMFPSATSSDVEFGGGEFGGGGAGGSWDNSADNSSDDNSGDSSDSGSSCSSSCGGD
ncbi:MAG: glycine-rich domain-containing protein [Bacteroidia bacterium]|jgi:hypothetical protein